MALVGDVTDVAPAGPSYQETLNFHDEESYQRKNDLETSTDDAESAADMILQSERDIVTNVISVSDDPTLNPWTVRAFIIGIGPLFLEASLIYYFKPQTIAVSLMFLAVVSYVLGISMETFIPRNRYLRWLNPGPFNTPNIGASIFMLFSSQLLGYGIGGMMRSSLLYSSRMMYPIVLPLISMFDALYKGGNASRRKLRMFYYVFCVQDLIWEMFPEWIFPLLTAFSNFCFANPNSAVFTQMFGGPNGNEGLGILSICFDWQYITAGGTAMTIPLKAQFSGFIGYLLCLVVFSGMYYGNIWQAQNFPFLSQLLYYAKGTEYNQMVILNSNYAIDSTLLAEQGLPWFSSTWVVYLLATNLGLAATLTHLLLWNLDDIRSAWSWASLAYIKESWRTFNWKFWQEDGVRDVKENKELDPHYLEMLKYPDVPNSWYFVMFVLSGVVSLVVIYKTDSTLPWWGFVIATLLAVVSILFFGALFAITGIGFSIQTFVQMIGGFLNPGQPWQTYTFWSILTVDTVSQAQLMLRDLKVAQYTKLPPRAVFTAQITGTLLGAVLNFVLMNSIIDSERPILLSIQGTNIWSGQQPQQYNSQAIAWGGLSHELFSVGKRYQWVAWDFVVGLFVPVPFWIGHRFWPKLRLDYLYTPVICYYIGRLAVGINSSLLSYFSVAFLSQWWMRTRHPQWFARYNYIVGAAPDGGTQVMVFILSFGVQGAARTSHLELRPVRLPDVATR